jgi:hypothetical protein
MTKDVLVPLYQRGAIFTAGKIEGLQKDYDILHRIFWETTSAKTGNFDEMHGFTVDLMFRSHANRGKGLKLDVMDYLLHEMSQAMFDRRVPPYAPYIQALINATWARTVGPHLTDSLLLTGHSVKALRIKAKHLAPPFAPAPEGEDDPAGGAHGGDGSPHSAHASPAGSPEGSRDLSRKKPSWVDRLMNKMKKSFCLKLEMQDRAYEAYVDARKSTTRQKAIMKKLDIPVSPETSRSITPKDQWISKLTWSSSEEEDDMEIDDTAHTSSDWPAWGAPSSSGPSYSGWDV